jgi:aryl-alcohol dehydrogenase-like predicted oxidoreductase
LADFKDTNPEMIKKAIERSYKALGGQRPIKLWQLHCPSSKYPLESIIAPIKEAISSGLIQFVGVSNLNINQIEKVRRALHIVSVQNEYNPWNRGPEKNGIIAYCRQNNLTFIPWSPVGQGYLYKTTLIKFSRLKELAVKKNCSVYSLILAWIMHKSNDIVPVTWSLKFSHIEDSIKSLYVKLTYDDVETIDQALDMIMWIFKQRPM